MIDPYTIGVLVPIWDQQPTTPPSQRAIGRLAQRLEQNGIRLVFGSESGLNGLSGWRVSGDKWMQTPMAAVHALYDRFPDQSQPEAYDRVRQNLADVPIFNAPSFTHLCRDKWALQQHLVHARIPMPEMVLMPAQFERALQQWGRAFLKPRYGSLGRGVRLVASASALSEALMNDPHPSYGPPVLQRAVIPPKGWGGVCIRVLMQRESGGGWVANPGVARCSDVDPVVNAARGAHVSLASNFLSSEGARRLQELLRSIGAVFDTHKDSENILEMGIDFVVDPDGCPHLIEINGKPKGRLAWLAKQQPDRFEGVHADAVARPFRRIARLLRGVV